MTTGAHKEGDDEWGCITTCVECQQSLVSASLPAGAKIFVIVQSSGRILSRYHCPRKECGDRGTCNLSTSTTEGAFAHMIECNKLVAQLMKDAEEVEHLLKGSSKDELLKKYRAGSIKHSKTFNRDGCGSGSGGGAAGGGGGGSGSAAGGGGGGR